MSKRAIRRHHKRRMKQKAIKIYSDWWSVREAIQFADNLKPCSCDMCCNPRRSPWAKGEKLTIQEHIELEKWKYSLESL